MAFEKFIPAAELEALDKKRRREEKQRRRELREKDPDYQRKKRKREVLKKWRNGELNILKEE